jgi:hypothetical protein
MCRLPKGLPFPGADLVTDDAEDDSIAAEGVGETGHGSGSAPDFSETSFNDIRGADLSPMGLQP